MKICRHGVHPASQGFHSELTHGKTLLKADKVPLENLPAYEA